MLIEPRDVVDTGTGERVSILRTGDETNGLYTEGISVFPPNLAASAYHEHPEQEERIAVVAGSVLVRLDGKLQLAVPGDTLVIPPGKAHEIANAGAETAEVIWQFRPALRTDDFLAAAMASEGRRESPLRHRLRKWAIAAEYSQEYRKANLPWSLQKPILSLAHRLVDLGMEHRHSWRHHLHPRTGFGAR